MNRLSCRASPLDLCSRFAIGGVGRPGRIVWFTSTDQLATRTRRGAHDARDRSGQGDRKSTRLNSSHLGISYAVFCLKKNKYIRERAPSRPAVYQQQRLSAALIDA